MTDAKMTTDAVSGAQSQVKSIHRIFILAWFCLLFLVYKTNPPVGKVSTSLSVALCALAVFGIVLGFVARERFFRLSAEALSREPPKAMRLWRGGHFVSFSCALNPATCGAVLKILGSGWLVCGTLFGLSLGSLLLLWRPTVGPAIDERTQP
jgi:hypothetical protein